MKKICILVMIFICACNKDDILEVTSIDQVPGKWEWESTCGGITYNCTYSSKSNHASIEFATGNKYTELHNDTIYLQTNYTISKVDDTFGTLILDKPNTTLPITILNNRLLITRGELMDSYLKIK
jgi:hypothetical protein